MRRRTLVVLVSAVTLLAIAIVAIGVVGIGVGTDPGREQIRGLIQRELAGRVNGTIHVGKVSGGLLRGFTLDSFAIRGPDDSILVSTGRVTVQYDPRDLLDRRILLRNVDVEHPLVRLEQYAAGGWNFQRIFKSGGRATPNVPGRDFGDFVVLDSVRVRNGTFLWVRPWSPDDTLSGAKRDSAIRVNVADPNREIRRAGARFTHTYRWSRISGFLPHVRIAHPDSARFGQRAIIEDLRVEELEPPFSFRNGRGVVRKQGDTVFINVNHFDLPSSWGRANGRIWWGSDLPVRVDVHLDGDSVALRDVAWVYPTLPREGGGRTKLRIRNNPANLHDFQYELTELDVRSTKSRLLGAMTFLVGGPVLVVKDVDLRAAPVNFDLLRTLAGGPFSADWQGDLIGYAKGPGGPLTHFVVDESNLTWRDTHVRGAVSRFGGRGELDILYPAFTKFHGFDVSVASLDLRSILCLFPDFLRIGGTVAGTATLDSSWLDVRFSKADVTHRNGPGDPSRVTGSGRVTWGEEFMTYDLDVSAEPVSLTMLSRAYPLHLKGLMTGPVHASGTSDSLEFKADLQGAAGRITYEGRVDAYPLSIAAFGGGRVEGLSFGQLVDHPKAPPGWITGGYDLRVRGDTNDLGTLQGNASLAVERAEYDGTRLFPSRIVARFADGRIHMDTLRVESVAASITASGALGLTEKVRDSLHYHVAVDSLGGLRPWITRFTGTPTQGVPDSLAGTVTVLGVARGSMASLDVSGFVRGSNMYVGREAGRDVTGSYDITDVLHAPTGTASVRFQALSLGGVALDTLGASMRLADGRSGEFTIGALGRNGATAAAAGDMAIHQDRSDIIVRQVSLGTDSSRWSLRAPAHVAMLGSGFSIDSLVLARNKGGGRMELQGIVPDSGRARILFRADSIPLYDIGYIAQLRTPLAGVANVTMQGAGTRQSPVMNAQAMLHDVRYGGLQAQRVQGTAEYVNNRAEVSLDLARHGRDALFARGSLPIALSYFGAEPLEDSLRGSIRTDEASFDIVEALIPGLSNATGSLVANLDIAGTWSHPDVAGGLKVEKGEVTIEPLGVRVRGVEIDLGLFGAKDSMAVRRMVGWSGTSAGDSVSIRGYIGYREMDNPLFNLRLDARTFHALDKRTLARLDVSTEPNGIRLRGPLHGATLTGGVVVDRGAIFLPDPELARKQRVDLSAAFLDTTARSRRLMPRASSRLMESLLLDDVHVTLGDEAWLRSREANIKLGGSLTVARVRSRRTTAVSIGSLDVADSIRYVPLLDGELRAERGTYTLVLGPVLQREFQVEGGSITFYPVEDFAPELNISALHTVRTQTGSGNAELRIRVRLTGPLYPNPIVGLESAESFPLSQSDLVSYLIFGQPNFELADAGQDYMKLAAQTLFPSAQSWATNSLRGWLGSTADIVQLHPGTVDASKVAQGTQLDAFQDFIWSTRLGTEKQLTQNVFVSLSTGICQLSGLGTSDQSAWEGWRESLSGKIEWRLSRDASIKAGKEPSGTVVCRPGSSMGRIVERPSQWGLSLFKTWRF